jgi:hypothetical protein
MIGGLVGIWVKIYLNPISKSAIGINDFLTAVMV